MPYSFLALGVLLLVLALFAHEGKWLSSRALVNLLLCSCAAFVLSGLSVLVELVA